jgi:hypothetical protein
MKQKARVNLFPRPRVGESEAPHEHKKITTLVLFAMLFALCSSVRAQQTGKVFRIGFLDSSTASGMAVLLDVFRQELTKLG